METPKVFFVLYEGRIGIGWQDDPEKGGCRIIRALPDDMLEEAYRGLLNRRSSSVRLEEPIEVS